MPKDLDRKYMSIALRLAMHAEGMTSPNPLVGSLIVKEGSIIGKGYHKRAGLPHAEIEAIKDAEAKGQSVREATLFVTLEPCCHDNKKNPPCVASIIEKGFSRVVVGTLDPNPQVNGRGLERLKENRIEVTSGVLEDKCREINESFFKYIRTGLPFVTLKLTATLDGKIATRTGSSKWIGTEMQRSYAHKLRRKADAIAVGVETVIQDDPQLTVRYSKERVQQPVPVVLDSNLRIPQKARLLKLHKSPIIATTPKADAQRIKELKDKGARVFVIDSDVREPQSNDDRGRVDIAKLINKLGGLEITNLLIEGGAQVAASALRAGVVDKVVFFYAPKILGGDGISMIGGLGISELNDAVFLKQIKMKRLGDEFVVEGYLARL